MAMPKLDTLGMTEVVEMRLQAMFKSGQTDKLHIVSLRG
jgi:hypothetical protein